MLYYREAGEGRLALFIHGFPLDHSLWLDHLAGLAHVRRCVAVDLRGFGRSDPVMEPSLSMEVLADDVAELVGALGADQADVVGLSMGGYVALALWSCARVVRTLTLADTRAAADSPEGREKREQGVGTAARAGARGDGGRAVQSLLAPGTSAQVRARLRSMVEGTRYETMVAALQGMRDRADRAHLLPTIDVPALVIGGEEDASCPPPRCGRWPRPSPGRAPVIVPAAGHLTPWSARHRSNEALIELFEGRKVVWKRAEG